MCACKKKKNLKRTYLQGFKNKEYIHKCWEICLIKEPPKCGSVVCWKLESIQDDPTFLFVDDSELGFTST